MRSSLLALALFLSSFALLATSVGAAGGGDLVVLLDHGLDGRGHRIGVDRLDVRDGRVVRDRQPADAPTLDARGLFVVPGLVDLRSGAGLVEENEESSEVTPWISALDFVDPSDPGFERALSSGITTVVVAPGGRAILGGVAVALKTDARPLDQRVVDRDAALVVTLGYEPTLGNRLPRFQTPYGLHFRRPGTRMGVVAEIRRSFEAAGAGDPDLLMLRRAAAGELPTWWRAHVEQDIRTAIRLSHELGLSRPVLLDPVEGHRVPELVAAECFGAVLSGNYQLPRSIIESWEGADFRDATPEILRAARVSVAVGTGPSDDPGILRDRAGLAARAGLPEDAAFGAACGVAATLLGQSERIGDLSPGHDADLVVLDGPPLRPSSRVLAVFVEGRLAWKSADLPAKAWPASLPAPASARGAAP